MLLFLAAVPFPPYGHDVKVGLAIAAAGVGVAAIAGIPTAFFQLHLRLELAALVDIVAAVVTVGPLLAVTRLDLGFYAVVATLPAAALVAGASAFALRAASGGSTSPRLARRGAARQERCRSGSSRSSGSSTKVDSLMLSVMRPAEDLGVYTVAYRFLEQALILPGLLMAAVFPLLVRAVQRSPDGKAILGRAVSLLLVVAVPLTLVLLVFAGPPVRLVAGRTSRRDRAAPDPLARDRPRLRERTARATPRRPRPPPRPRDGERPGAGAERRDEPLGDPGLRLPGAAVTTVVSEIVGVVLVAWFARRAYPFELGGARRGAAADLRLILGR